MTQNITDFEKKIAEAIALILIDRNGLPITNKEIAYLLLTQGFPKIYGDTVIRKMVNYIRTHRLVNNLIASNEGYYLTDDLKKVEKYIKSLNGRINAIKETLDSFHATIS